MTGQSLLVEQEAFRIQAGNRARFGGRWRLVSAGLSNVWRYGDLVLPAQSGRLLMRGPNGTGKTTALEALWPFLLDLDKSKLRAGQSRTTTLTSLMREGQNERKRVGYAWLTFTGPGDEGTHSYGARLVFSNGSTPTVRVEPFAIPGEPLTDMALTGPGRSTITTADGFREIVEAAGGIAFRDEHEYVTALGNRVFNASRSDLISLADRVRKVRNPSLLAATTADQAAQALREALPCVSQDVISATGDALAATDETRAAFERNEEAATILTGFASVWAGHAADVAIRMAATVTDARSKLVAARKERDRMATSQQAAVTARDAEEATLDDAMDRYRKSSAEVSAIERSPAYADVGRLADLRETADAQAREGTAHLDRLKSQNEHVRRDTAALHAEAEALATAAALSCTQAIGHDPVAAKTAPAFAVSGRPQSVLRVGSIALDPGPGLRVEPHPDTLSEASTAWSRLATGHEDHAAGATMMLREHDKVAAADRDAHIAATAADAAEKTADRAVQERDKLEDNVRAAAARLSAEVSRWAGANQDLTLTEQSDPLTADDITQAVETGPAGLLAVADQWSLTARGNAEGIAARVTSDASGKDELAASARTEALDLGHRATELRSGGLLPLPRPAWAGPAAGTTFGSAVEWVEDATDPTGRALVESALSAAGVLGAAVDDGGAATNVWALTTTTPPVARSLCELIAADPAHPLADTVRQVLTRIAISDTADDTPPDIGAVIGRDGTFRFGVITGRAPGADDPADLPAASHIGAAQRRAAALAEADRLDTKASSLARDAKTHEAEAALLREKARAVKARAASFPETTELASAERERAAAAYTAKATRMAAEEAVGHASRLRRDAHQAGQQWRDKTQAMGLPADRDKLTIACEGAIAAARGLREAASAMAGHQSALLRVRSRAKAIDSDRHELAELHAAAETAHRRADFARTEYEKIEAVHGQEAADLTARLQAAKEHAESAETDITASRGRLTETEKALARAESDYSFAQDRARDQEPSAAASASSLRALVSVPAVTDAVLAGEVPAGDDDALVRQVTAATTGVTVWGKKKVADEYETARARLAGVWAVDRADGHGDELDTYQCTYDGSAHTPAAAATLARDLAARAGEQLHEAEESALRDFIIGRLPAAIGAAWHEQRDWVTDVNRKMESASASSGVGVRVRTTLRDDLTPTQRTVQRLACRKSAATRSGDEDRELAEALKGLLNAADGATVTDRVHNAVDVRDWVRVDYLVHRPGQEPKRWTKNTGLSGGERRLVILAPMLASVAALYDNLPPSALRLAALDEVPAEVDEQGREGLARYIAELDLDIICTSYLWDGAPGAWDGVDAHDLEAGPDGVVVAFPMLVRGLDPLPGDPDGPQ